MPKDQRASLSTTRRDVVFKGRIWNVVAEQFDYNGQELTREFVAHPGAVAVVALNEDREVLLINQYRHPVRSYLWEIPAGLLDMPGESKLEAAKRELRDDGKRDPPARAGDRRRKQERQRAEVDLLGEIEPADAGEPEEIGLPQRARLSRAPAEAVDIGSKGSHVLARGDRDRK